MKTNFMQFLFYYLSFYCLFDWNIFLLELKDDDDEDEKDDWRNNGIKEFF